MSRHAGLTLLEVLMHLVLLMMLAVLLVPSLASHGRSSRRMMNIAQLRGIHQAVVMYSMDNGGYYPGLDASGAPAALDVRQRFKILLDGNFFTPEYMINPSETASNIHEWQSGPFTSDHYSYAMLQVPAAGARYDEWQDTLNPDAIVMADRNTGTPSQPTSVFTGQRVAINGSCSLLSRAYKDWVGGIVKNDNSTQFTESHRHPTEYAGHAHVDDHLFEAAGDDDAYLVHRGN